MNMRITILPKTRLGRWAVGLVAGYILLIILLVVWRIFLVGVAIDASRFQSVAYTIHAATGGFRSWAVVMQPVFLHFGWTRETLWLIYNALLIIKGAVSIGALVTGLIGIIRSKERSILVFISTAIGSFLLILAVVDVVQICHALSIIKEAVSSRL